MDTSGYPSAPYFYFHLPSIHELGVLIPLTYFEVYFLKTVNVTPSQITLNVWSKLRPFQMICCILGVPSAIRLCLSFFST